MEKTNIKNFIKKLMIVGTICFIFFLISYWGGNKTFGASGNGYGYNCDDVWGPGYSCSDDEEHDGIEWNKYQKYKDKYRNDEFRTDYWKVKSLKKSDNPALVAEFWNMRQLYLTHKFDDDITFSKLSPILQQKFFLYKHYHGHKKYRELKDEFDD